MVDLQDELMPLSDSSSPVASGDGLAAMHAAAASTDAELGPSTGKQVSLASTPVSVATVAAPDTAAAATRLPALPVPGSSARPPMGSMARGDSFTASAAAADIREGRYQTLDEPVRETIMRDVRSVAEKIRYVMMPQARDERALRLKDWDLWGPLLLCLSLGLMLASQAADDEQASYAFADVFCIVWVGSAVVTLNASLLRGNVSFFQSVCVLGYCMCPLVIAAFISMLLQSTWFKVIAVGAGTFWSTGASVGYMGELVQEDRTALAVYPVWLFYIAIAWMILLA